MGNHSYYFEFLGSKVKTPVPTFGEATSFSLPLGKQSMQRNFPSREDSKISVHGENIFVVFHDRNHPYSDGFLTDATEPF